MNLVKRFTSQPSLPPQLYDLGIQTADELWAAVAEEIGENPSEAIERLAARAGMREKELVDLLTTLAMAERRQREGNRYERGCLVALIFGLLLTLITVVIIMVRSPTFVIPLAVLFVFLAAITALAMRAFGALDEVASPIGTMADVPILKQDLLEGHQLQLTDFETTHLPFREVIFTDLDQLEKLLDEGLYLSKDVTARGPLQFDDVEREQVVVSKSFVTGEIIPGTAVTTERRSYDSRAFTDVDDVAWHAVTMPILNYSVVLEHQVVSSSVTQVVSTEPLPAFRPIRGDKLELAVSTPVTDSFDRFKDVEGRVPLRPINGRQIIKRSDISSQIFIPASLKNRHILSLPVSAGAYTDAAIPGQHVKVIFSPQADQPVVGVSKVLNDVLILHVEPGEDGEATFVFAVKEDPASLAPVLGNSALFVVHDAP